MDDVERIRKMVADGRITQGEGERLISVLKQIDGAEGELAASERAMEAEAREVRGDAAPPETTSGGAGAGGSAPGAPAAGAPMGREPGASDAPRAPDPPRPSRPPQAAEQPGAPARGRDWMDEVRDAGAAAARAAGEAVGEVGRAVFGASAPSREPSAPTAAAPEGTRWVTIQLLAGDLSVRVDPSLEEPRVRGDHGDLSVERCEGGFRIAHAQPSGDGGWVDRLMSKMRHGDLDVRIPAELGVELAMTAGDVVLRDVPYLRGRLTAGDLDATGLRGIDFATAAGDVDVELLLTSGSHLLRATAGDVSVRLKQGSSARLTGSVSIGDASVKGGDLKEERRGVGHAFSGTVGKGEAEFRVSATTGDVKVRVDDER